MSDVNDDELRARFSALRKHDTYAEPDFREMLGKAERTRTGPAPIPSRVRWIPIAATIVLGAALLIGKTCRHSDTRAPISDVPSITSWQSPTAGLLNTPSRALLDPPSLLSSVFDGVTQTTVPPAKAD